MFYSGASRPLNVQNLTNNELIDLIKNDEYYSGCCRILEEKKLGGIDVLNLSENRLATWRLPEWLSKKLISLKEKLSKDPESFLTLGVENPDLKSRRKISSTLTTLLKNNPTPKLPLRKPADESSESASKKKEIDSEPLYDDDDYLKPELMRGTKEPKFDKLTLKFPNQRGQDVPYIPSRKPIALPRPDSNDEENDYELPPSHTIELDKTASKLLLPLPPPPDEVIMDDYELPPRFSAKPSESPEELDYEYVETNKRENSGIRSYVSTSKFYVDNDFPPPIPERSISQKKEAKKSLIPSLYMNVDRAQSPSSNSNSSERTSSLPRNRKANLKPTRSISPVIPDTKKSETKKPWSTYTRPLPPLPLVQDNQSSKPKAAKKEVEPREEQVEYENHAHTPEKESLPDYLNTTESSNTSSKPGFLPELKSKTLMQYPKDRSNDLRSHISNVKLNNSHTIKTKQSTTDESAKMPKEKLEKRRGNIDANSQSKKEMTLLKSQMKLPLPPSFSLPVPNGNYRHNIHFDKEDENSEYQPEYGNTSETITKPIARRTQQNIPSPVSDFTKEISQIKLKPTSTTKRDLTNFPERKWLVQDKQTPSDWKQHGENQNDFEDHREIEDLPEYGNTAETKTKPTASRTQQYMQSPVGMFTREIPQVKLKPTQNKELGNFPEKNLEVREKKETSPWELHGETGSDSEENHEQDDSLHHPNTSETQGHGPKVKRSGPNIQAIASQITKVKLKPTSKKDVHRDDSLSDELRNTFQKRKGQNEKMTSGRNIVNSYHQINSLTKTTQNSNANIGDDKDYLAMSYNDLEDQPEYGNIAETATKPTAWITQQNITVSQFAHEISQIKLKSNTPIKESGNSPERKWGVLQEPSVWEHHGESGSDFEEDDDEQDDLPEYLNTLETQEPEPKEEKTGPNTQAITSSLASQFKHVQLKPTPKKDIHLDDNLADELRALLQRRKELNKGITDSYPLTESQTTKSQNLNPDIVDIENYIDGEDEEDIEGENYDVAGSYNDLRNINNEPFYRNTDRKGAIMLLEDLEDGAFLLRPSRKYFLSLTIKNKGKFFNVGIEKTSNNKIFSGEDTMRTKEFFSLKSFLEHFEHFPLILQGENGLQEVYLKKVLPPNKY